MPGGHCPIVRPHPHQTKKNKPRVGDPPFIECGWCGAHTKQARDKQSQPQTHDRNAKRFDHVFVVGIVCFLHAWCARTHVRVCIHVHVDAHLRYRKTKHEPSNQSIGFDALVTWFMFLSCLLGVRSAHRSSTKGGSPTRGLFFLV